MRIKLPQPRVGVLPDRILLLGEEGKEAVMKKWGLKREGPSPKYTRTRKGTDAETSGTSHDYERIWKHMHRFSLECGFFEDAVLLDRETCPDRPLPMSPDAVRLYVSYQFGARGTVLEHPDTKVPVKDVLGLVLHCTGHWNAPNNADKTRSAVKVLHDLYENLRGPYVAACTECIKYTEEFRDSARHSACDMHAGRPRLRPQGNVVTEHKVRKHIESEKNAKGWVQAEGQYSTAAFRSSFAAYQPT
jgi:hypothetical protein